MTFEDIAVLALALPVDQRQGLVAILIDSIPDAPQEEIDAAWDAEIERRVADFEAGRVKLIPWEQVRAEADRILNPDRKSYGHE